MKCHHTILPSYHHTIIICLLVYVLCFYDSKRILFAIYLRRDLRDLRDALRVLRDLRALRDLPPNARLAVLLTLLLTFL